MSSKKTLLSNIQIIKSDTEPNCANQNCSDKLSNFFKSCHYCFTFYCSKECREIDWIRHKYTLCYYGRLASCCKKILTKVGRNVELRDELSKIAKTGYEVLARCKQRGFVWLDFSSDTEAHKFIAKPENLLPRYVYFDTETALKSLSQCKDDVLSRLFSNYLDKEEFKIEDEELASLLELIKTYDPYKEFLLLASIRVDKKCIRDDLKPRRLAHVSKNVLYILKFMKMDLRVKNEISETSDQAATLILTSLKREKLSESTRSTDEQEDKELFLANLLNEFQMRGIDVRNKFPKIYKDLCLYVEEDRPFTPLCLFPRDLNKNKLFMCLILPNSEPVDYQNLFNDACANGEQDNELIQAKIRLSRYLCIQ